MTRASSSEVQKGRIEYVVWSDVFHCSSCGTELIYWDLVFRGPRQEAPEELICTGCGAVQTLRSLDRAWITRFDHELGETVRQAYQIPVLINYRFGKSRYEKVPDDQDLALLRKLDESPLLETVPIVELPQGFNTAQPRLSHGFSHVHHFFTRRNLLLMSYLWNGFRAIPDPFVRAGALYVLTGTIQRVCRLNRYMPTHDRHVGPLSGTLYVSQLTAEIPVTNYALERIRDLRRCATGPRGQGIRISTQSATDLRNIPNQSIDYIFTDPPFGGNLNYSELNSLVEAWIEVYTNPISEAIVNQVQKKSLHEYHGLMRAGFTEFYRTLKPGRWITVEFHNSQNSVWNAIQESLWAAGFVVADVQTLDKQKGTTKQLTYGATVKQDLIISAYKPVQDFSDHFESQAGTERGAWEFVRQHLGRLSRFIESKGNLVTMAERQPFLLYDRMVAFHIQRMVTVPLSASEFYAGLRQRFSERDGMVFLPEQVAEYDSRRAQAPGVEQLALFVNDEKTAVQWLRQLLENHPLTYQEIHPRFQPQLHQAAHEQVPELMDMLSQNFLKDEQDRWYVPDPNKQSDLEKLRERGLLREFEVYAAGRGKLKAFRSEAVRAGFSAAWRNRDYATIVRVAQRLPEAVLQEDAQLLMYYDNASTRVEG
jgi:hypothetical protein